MEAITFQIVRQLNIHLQISSTITVPSCKTIFSKLIISQTEYNSPDDQSERD